LARRIHCGCHGSWHIYRPRRALAAAAARDARAGRDRRLRRRRLQRARRRIRARADVGARDTIATLGPDLLAPDFDAAEGVRRLRDARR
jgi:hypothetical protein